LKLKVQMQAGVLASSILPNSCLDVQVMIRKLMKYNERECRQYSFSSGIDQGAPVRKKATQVRYDSSSIGSSIDLWHLPYC
jgi:hypothetical protein